MKCLMSRRSNTEEHIYIPSKLKKELLTTFNVSYGVVADALKFSGNSQKQRKIRMYALNHLNATPINLRFN